MSIHRITPDPSANINPVDPIGGKGNLSKADKVHLAHQLEGDVVEISQEARLAHELARVQQMLADVPEPNAARLAELKESIAQGTYLTRKVLDETSAILARQLLG